MKFRCGRKQPQNLYVQQGDEAGDEDQYIGVIFDPARAAVLIDIVNGERPPLPQDTEIEKAADSLSAVRGQAQRYLRARYSSDYIYRAPETFENALERWIWAVAGDAPALAEECIKAIEEHFGGEHQ
jgi:hypothetical protein